MFSLDRRFARPALKLREAVTRATGLDWHTEKLLAGEVAERFASRHCAACRNWAIALFGSRMIVSWTRASERARGRG